MNKKIITRFAPSPTGYLHLGGAKTAMFAWVFARKMGGEFKLRIEDTDRERYYPEAVNVIYRDLKWLIGGMDFATVETPIEEGAVWDELMESQYARAGHHTEMAKKLIENGTAYYCYLSSEKLEVMRDEARKNGGVIVSPYRDLSPEEAKKFAVANGDSELPVVRLKTPTDGFVIINDLIQGEIKVANSTLDDFIIVRSNGNPIYLFSCVIDDFDQGVTHVIRGSDHINNAFRQSQIYKAFGWELPEYAHLPLLTDDKGAKLSKRVASVAVWDYKEKGILPEALFNYLIRVGWSHGEDEIITREQAVEWFNFASTGRANARFDANNITHLNVHYLKEADDSRLLKICTPILEEKLGRKVSDDEKNVFLKAMPDLKCRVKNLLELVELSEFLFDNGLSDVARFAGIDEKSKNTILKGLDDENAVHFDAKKVVENVILGLGKVDFKTDILNKFFCDFSEENKFKLGKFLMLFRIGICFSTITPPLFEMMEIMGKEKSINRLKSFCDSIK